MLLATINSSIVLISLPAIFTRAPRPAAAGNVSYLLWMLMGYMLVTAVLVVTSAGSATCSAGSRSTTRIRGFTVCSVILSLDPFTGATARCG